MGAISAISSAAAGYVYGAGSGALAADLLQSGRFTDWQILLLALLVFGPAGAALGVLTAYLRSTDASSARL